MADQSTQKESEDFSGRDRLFTNVIWSWLAQLVVIAAGFIVPRLMDEYIGIAMLGTWDFCWSLVNYLQMMALGVGSVSNRYISQYRTVNDTEGLNNIVSTLILIQVAMFSMAVVVTIGMVMLMPLIMSEKLGEELITAQWVVAILGLTTSIQFLFEPCRGIVTGCHRWDLHNGLNATSRVLTLLCMMLLLTIGGGLIILASIFLVVGFLTELIRLFVARRVCPEIKLSGARASFKQARELVWFGIKTSAIDVPYTLVSQSTSVLIGTMLGPTALAIFARPVGLVRQVQTFINRFAFMLAPTAGALQGSEQMEDLKTVLIYSMKYALAMTLPITMLLAIYGDLVLQLWMGDNYVNHLLIAIVAIGMSLPLGHSPCLSIVIGLNIHGRMALIVGVATLLPFGLWVLALNRSGWSIELAAMALVSSLTLGYGLVLPGLACYSLGVSIKEYVSDVLGRPLLCVFVFVVLLTYIRSAFEPGWTMLLAISIAGSVLAVLYWFFLLTADHRDQALKILSRFGPGSAATTD